MAIKTPSTVTVTPNESYPGSVNVQVGEYGRLAVTFVGWNQEHPYLMVSTEYRSDGQPSLTIRGVAYRVNYTLTTADGTWLNNWGTIPRDLQHTTCERDTTQYPKPPVSESARADLWYLMRLAAEAAVREYPDGWRQARMFSLRNDTRHINEEVERLNKEIGALLEDRRLIAAALTAASQTPEGQIPTWIETPKQRKSLR